MNQTYLHIYDILDNTEVLEAKLQSAPVRTGGLKEEQGVSEEDGNC